MQQACIRVTPELQASSIGVNVKSMGAIVLLANGAKTLASLLWDTEHPVPYLGAGKAGLYHVYGAAGQDFGAGEVCQVLC